MTQPSASFHIVGCVLAREVDPVALEDCLDWARRYGAIVLTQDLQRAEFVRFDATGGQLIVFGARAALARRPPNLRFSYASVVKELGPDGPRAAERGVQQARDLAAAAQPGQVLVSSQLGSLLQMAEVEPHERLRPLRLPLAGGRTASAYLVEALRGTVGPAAA